MVLISLLLALAIERVYPLAAHFEFSYLFNRIREKLPNNVRQAEQNMVGVLILSAIPASIVFYLMHVTEGVLFGLGQLLLSTLVVLLAIGCSVFRELYRHYVKAGCRGDTEACAVISGDVCERVNELNQCDGKIALGESLLWVNYQYYLAVMIWLLIFGPAGVAFYATLRTLAGHCRNDEGELIKGSSKAQRLLQWCDWFPARVAAFGYLLIGHFTEGVGVWLHYLLDPSLSPRQFLIRVALAAERAELESGCAPFKVNGFLVGLAKRNVLLMLLLVALLSIYGHVY